MTGRDYQSLVVRSYEEMCLLDRIGHRFVLFELQHFIFFGSAAQVLDLAKDLVARQDPRNLANHVRLVYKGCKLEHHKCSFTGLGVGTLTHFVTHSFIHYARFTR